MHETRRRIVRATFELHATKGPSRTTVSAIAERAGVQRHTVYSHFPDLGVLYDACTRHGMEETAMPDPTPWMAIDDRVERLQVGLSELYGWYRANETMLSNVLQEGPLAPPAESDPFSERMTRIVNVLAGAWPAMGPDRRAIHRAVLIHAVEFATWRSLTGAGLSDRQAVRLLVAVAAGVAADALAGD